MLLTTFEDVSQYFKLWMKKEIESLLKINLLKGHSGKLVIHYEISIKPIFIINY